jgi:N-acetylneuraminate synthase
MMIAEMSGNHNGSLEAALRIVDAAATHGADAIKLQTYTPATLTIDSHRPEFFIDDPESLWHQRRLWELYEEAHTPWEWHAPIFAAMRAAGLACISSAYDLSSLDFLLSLNIDAIKIASFELVHLPLIEAAARSGKPLLVSTGMGTIAEIDDAVAAMRDNGCHDFVLLKCTSAYPAEERDANLLTMDDMRARYECEVGLSDHTLSHFTAFAASALGAAVVEKHFTIARADGGVDSAFSVEPHEWRALSDGCALVWQSRGAVHYGPLPSEATSLKERPSIYVARAMRRGETFDVDNIRIIRPANGVSPAHYHSIIGRTSARDLAAGEPLALNDVTEESR